MKVASARALDSVEPDIDVTVEQDSDQIAFAKRLQTVQSQIAQACTHAGRNPSEVRVLPVSKTVSHAGMRTAIAAGFREFGENRVQEAMHKAEVLHDVDLRWSIIGHLQTNKARYVARFAHEVQSLDSEKLVRVLDRNLQSQQRTLDVYVQVNSSFEPSKYGLTIEEVPAFVRSLNDYRTLRFRGLMTLAVFNADEPAVRACFERMRHLRTQLRQEVLEPKACCKLSMGMSGDFEIAIEEGADVVRIGQALFGARGVPDSHYWPGVQVPGAS